MFLTMFLRTGNLYIKQIWLTFLGRDDEGAAITAVNLTITYHSIFLAVCVGSSATDTTVYTLLVIDFVLNFGSTCHVFYR